MFVVTGAARAAAQDPTLSTPPSAVGNQPPSIAPDTPYRPIDGRERATWIVDGVVGARSLFIVGPLAALWQTGVDVPSEWERTWAGLGRRYAQREADVAISNALEAGVGAMWGEDPRYRRSARHGIWPRATYAIHAVFLAPRRDGRMAPAWGRVVGNVANNLIENAWLPPSAVTPGQTAVRSANGMLGRLAGNLWEEFWPDVRARLAR
jgi:hypothetical protein